MLLEDSSIVLAPPGCQDDSTMAEDTRDNDHSSSVCDIQVTVTSDESESLANIDTIILTRWETYWPQLQGKWHLLFILWRRAFPCFFENYQLTKCKRIHDKMQTYTWTQGLYFNIRGNRLKHSPCVISFQYYCMSIICVVLRVHINDYEHALLVLGQDRDTTSQKASGTDCQVQGSRPRYTV